MAEKLPDAWVNRIFDRLAAIYTDRWLTSLGHPITKHISLIQWSTGLAGLTPDEIKKALAMCQAYSHASVPTVVEFYHYAKGLRQVVTPKPTSHSGNAEIAKQHLDLMRQRLTGKKCST